MNNIGKKQKYAKTIGLHKNYIKLNRQCKSQWTGGLNKVQFSSVQVRLRGMRIIYNRQRTVNTLQLHKSAYRLVLFRLKAIECLVSVL